ncbi:DUF975 family protein [Paenibacillus thalictri]|nr:DUF975 family protein [Paenibacillus thalictri]
MVFVNASQLKPNDQLREMARSQLAGRWGIAILTCFLYFVIIVILNSIKDVGSLATTLVSGSFALGLSMFFVTFPRGGTPDISQLFAGFKRFLPALGLSLMIGLLTFLWTLLLIVPGIIAALRYSQAFYIMNDNPDIGVMDAIRTSKEMMDGQKMKLFLLQLSFIGWFLLGCITFGIAMLWVYPYFLAAMANFYEDLRQASSSTGDPFKD